MKNPFHLAIPVNDLAKATDFYENILGCQRGRASDSWIDFNENKVGYEINFTKHFYQYNPLRSSEEITNELLKLEEESQNLFNQVVE